jgi:hypothetical protein
MKTNSYIQKSLALLAAVGALFSAAVSHAAVFYVTIDTSALLVPPASTAAPFYLDFQFNDGGILNNNIASLTVYDFGGGSATGSAVTFGGATGDIATGVLFDNTASFQELYQGFTPGTSLTFVLNMTTAMDVPAPDAFFVSILDSSLQNITTNGFGNSLVNISLDAPTPTETYSLGNGDFAGVAATAVPEPTSLGVIMTLGVAGLAALRRKRLNVA